VDISIYLSLSVYVITALLSDGLTKIGTWYITLEQFSASIDTDNREKMWKTEQQNLAL
jgi:hypothetical protein